MTIFRIFLMLVAVLVAPKTNAQDMLAEKHMRALDEVLYENIPSGPYSVYVDNLAPVNIKMYPAVLFFESRSGLMSDIAEHTVRAFLKRVHVFNEQPNIDVVAYIPPEEKHDALYRALVEQRLRNVIEYLVQHQNISADNIETDVRPAGVVPCTLAPRECSSLLHRVELYASAK